MKLDAPTNHAHASAQPSSDIEKGEAYAAVERAAKRLLQARADGEITPERVAESLAELPPTERALAQHMFDRLVERAGEGPVTREVIQAFVTERTEEIKRSSLDWNLSDDEIAGLSETGKLAVELARKLKDVDVLESVACAAFNGLKPEEIMAKVRQLSGAHVELGYSLARLLMFSDLDNWQGLVRGVYTRGQVETIGIPDVQTAMFNTEHTWPKARGVKGTAAMSDLHHLFPADQEANAQRGNHPFGEVVTPTWEKDGSRLGEDAAGNIVFEPPDRHKGNIARALFYVSAVYELPFPPGEREVLARWNQSDPVDAGEFLRNDAISKVQGNRNLFIDHPHLIDEVVHGSKNPAHKATAGQKNLRQQQAPANAAPTRSKINTPSKQKHLPAWWPSDYSLEATSRGVADLMAKQGFALGDAVHIKSLTFADADHTFLKTDAPILLRNLKGGELMRHPTTKELLLLPNRGFREAFETLKAEHPNIAWDEWEYAFGEMGSRQRILDTPAIPSTMAKLRHEDRREDAHAHVVTARSAKGAAEGLREYLRLRDIEPGVIFTPNETSHAQLLHMDDSRITSQQRKALTLAATLRLYQEHGAAIEDVSFYDDSDGNLRAAMQLLPEMYPEIRFSFFDIIHTGDDQFRHRLVASTTEPGRLGTPAGRPMTPGDIEAYRSKDAPLPPPIAR